MVISIFICLLAFVVLVQLVRTDSWSASLGLPAAYLFGLLLIHVPGAIAHSVSSSSLSDSEWTATGIHLTAIGSLCFIAGVWLARRRKVVIPRSLAASQQRFWVFCLLAGWLVVYGLSRLGRIPSLGAAIEKGGAVWMLGVLLGLRSTVHQGSPLALLWGATMLVYPVLMLLLGGFLSYGSTAIMICLAALVVSTRNHWHVALGIMLASIIGFHLFLSYFGNRDAIRDAVWGGADLETRVERATGIFKDLKWFDPNDPKDLQALDARLNQNYFVGLAAARIEAGDVEYLWGRSVWEGVLALVPRIIWPEKPVYAGSPQIVSEMTGLRLAEGTSFGVGNVMEFYINFGIAGAVGGFLLLGWALGRLDLLAARAERSGNVSKLFLYFLPAVALIQPNGSIVELTSGAAAGWIAAWAWGWAWREWSSFSMNQTYRVTRQGESIGAIRGSAGPQAPRL
jgi:hypothetical protein